jgi:hypothetical protein
MGDSILEGLNRDPMYVYEDLLMRRRLAALARQNRTVQILTKNIQVFRAAYGLPQQDDEPKANDTAQTRVYNNKVARAPDRGDNFDLPTASYDTKWAKGMTARGLAEVSQHLTKAGYKVSRESDDAITTWSFQKGHDNLQLQVVGSAFWCAAAIHNGNRIPLFDFSPNSVDDISRGVPSELASDDWDGRIAPADAQNYATSWARLKHYCKQL